MNLNVKIITFLIALAATAFAVVLGVFIGSGDILIPALVIVGFAAVVLIAKPQWAAFGAVATFYSGVTIPGLPGQMRLFDAFVLAMLGIYILQICLKTGTRLPFSRLEWIVLAYCVWIFFIGAYRGFGFLSFGSDKIGGFYYVRLLLSGLFVIMLPRIGLSPGKWTPVMIAIAVLAPATVIGDMLVIKGWDFGLVRLFVQTGSDATTMTQGAGFDESSQRLFSAGPAANALLIALLCLVPMKRFFQFRGIPWLACFGGIFALSLLSGFRLMTVIILLIAFIALFIQKAFTVPRVALLCLVGCVGVFALYVFARDLPYGFQRALSWLPGIHVTTSASADAYQTVDWRLRLWHEALRYLPDYWLIGKGFSYRLVDILAAIQGTSIDDLQWALVMGAYHNGWLSMLLCTGLIGTILSLILLIAPIIQQWKLHSRSWNNITLKRFHSVFLAALAANCIIFVLFYGDVTASFPAIFFQWAILNALVRSDMESAENFEPQDRESAYPESIYQDA